MLKNHFVCQLSTSHPKIHTISQAMPHYPGQVYTTCYHPYYTSYHPLGSLGTHPHGPVSTATPSPGTAASSPSAPCAAAACAPGPAGGSWRGPPGWTWSAPAKGVERNRSAPARSESGCRSKRWNFRALGFGGSGARVASLKEESGEQICCANAAGRGVAGAGWIRSRND